MSDVEKGDKFNQSMKEIYYYYGSDRNYYASKKFSKTEFIAKKFRQMYFKAGDFKTHKHIIPVKRLRTKDEGLFKLLEQREIACLLEGREEFPDIDFVLDRNLVKKLDGYVFK